MARTIKIVDLKFHAIINLTINVPHSHIAQLSNLILQVEGTLISTQKYFVKNIIKNLIPLNFHFETKFYEHKFIRFIAPSFQYLSFQILDLIRAGNTFFHFSYHIFSGKFKR